MSSSDRVVDFSHEFVISCGTVCIDPAKRTVLLLRHRTQGTYHLAKGRKNQGESFDDAAVRETTEETGYLCHLMAHAAITRAPYASDTGDPAGEQGQPPGGLHTEPIAVQQRMYDNRVRKLVFWYLAEADSMQVPFAPVEDGLHYDAAWLGFDIAAGKVMHWDDQKVIERGLEIFMS